MNDSIREKMERWARYRHFRHGGYGKTMLQRVMDGMPGTICPTCVQNNVVGAGIGMQAQVKTARGELSQRVNDGIEGDL